MGALKVQKFSDPKVDRQAGEVARLRVLKGPDRGTIFIVKASSTVVGRGDEADVRVSDVKTSRTHARLDYTHEGWMVSDLGSANGIFFHGEFCRKFNLRSGEHFTVGDSIFEFLASTEKTSFLTSPLRSGTEVQLQDNAFEAQKLKVQSYSKPKNAVSTKSNGKKTNSKTILLIGALAAIYYFMDQDSAPKLKVNKPVDKKVSEEIDAAALQSYLPDQVSKDVGRTAEQYYRQGFREYRERNYMRAKAQFQLALQVDPSHKMARHYLAIAEQEIITDIKKMIQNAQKAVAAGRLRAAKGSYESAMRLMYHDKENPDYIECEDAVKKINKELERSY